ncbi:PREDICTED: uncharacterized protein LOC107082513 isoform X4 [Cyprinodon variegatus]|uniref:uncharacterized protein LOC107082513 isoform X4 n=1 Tax=Cyprinodon variegatus TaxID=28743 RepID=UPI0007425DAB|nr:PREDICTED: uncharacterized protein LOC107082513 isoform X4 [Cyprinodon variegatus]
MLDVLIIGGGPHALTLASLLYSPDPDQDSDGEDDSLTSTPILSNFEKFKPKPYKKRRKRRTAAGQTTMEQTTRPTLPESTVYPPLSILVVDTYGEWAALWESQFTALNIPHLRSHTLVHTDPFNKVRRYKLDKIMVKGTVEKIIPVTGDTKGVEGDQKAPSMTVRETEKVNGESRQKIQHFCVELQDGRTLKARQVVLATGPTRSQMSNIPEWVENIGESYPEGRLQHTVHLMHNLPNSKQRHLETEIQKQEETSANQVCEAGQRVMVVGGGLTSAHVVSIALQQGASHVTWVMRKHLQLKQFDVGDVESLVGRYSHVEHGIKMDGQAYLRQFYNERSLHKRLAMIRQARKGGAITPEAYIHLQPSIESGQVELKTFCQVNEASWCYRSQTWNLSLSSGDQWTGDRIWLATGCKLDVKQDPLLSDVMKKFPIQVVDGWPCILESLQWMEGCPLYLMGQYTALQIGPHAVNLAGGQAASMRIAKDIVHYQKQNREQDPQIGQVKSRIEEYIKQMEGLFWL